MPFTLKQKFRDFLGGPVVKTAPPLQGVQDRSLVGELRSCMLHGLAKNLKKKIKIKV